MSEPPALPEPIKPPNGKFSLEERKWREGITRALRNLQIRWGGIVGTLSDQTDLQTALDSKQAVIDADNKLDYNLLKNTPTIPTVNDAILNLQQNGTTVGTFSANASSGVSLNFTDTNKTSGITVNSSLIPDDNNAYDLGDNTSIYKELHVKNAYCSSNVYIGNSATFGTNQECLISQFDSGTGLIIRVRNSGNNAYRYIAFDDDSLSPTVGDTIDLGTSVNRWRTIYTNNNVSVSDARAKDNIEDLENALDKLNTIKVKSYILKEHDEGIMYGFIAQDEVERNPELVVVPINYSEEKGGGELLYMPNNVLFLAVKAVQELSEKVKNLEGEMKKLKESMGGKDDRTK